MPCQHPYNIQRFQEEYQNLLIDYECIFQRKGITCQTISFLLDELKYFWLERLAIIDFELEELTETKSSLLLCGAIYLNIEDYEHFYFKSLGKYHFLFDPFLKMENIIRNSKDTVESNSTIEYFKKVLNDTKEILTHYKNSFFILPARILAIKDEQKHNEMLSEFFLRFLSSTFNKDFEDQNDFCQHFQTFEQIEHAMQPNVSKSLLFNGDDVRGMSLRDKLEQHCNGQLNFGVMSKQMTEPQIFLMALFSWVSQALDALLVCSKLKVIPYIRFRVSMHYFTLIMHSFIEYQELKEVIEKTIILYIFRKTIALDFFEKQKFSEYCLKIQEKKILSSIIEEIRQQKIDILFGGTEHVQSIINLEFAKYSSGV